MRHFTVLTFAIVTLALAVTDAQTPAAQPRAVYVGSERCKTCHAEI